jgi:hypothetical protein
LNVQIKIKQTPLRNRGFIPMKTNNLPSLQNAVGMLLTAACLSCQTDAPDGATEQNFIAEIAETTQSADLEGQSTKTFAYNDGKLTQIKWMFISKFKSSPDQRTTQSTEAFGYDANGFLTSKTLTETTEDLSASGKRTTQKSVETQYSYQNEKLIKEVEQRRINNQSGTRTVTYEYETNGQLRKRTLQDAGGRSTTWTYTNGVLTSITRKEANGADGQPVTVQNGLAVREVFADKSFMTYDYDAQKRLIKATVFGTNGQTNSYYVNDWAAIASPEDMVPALKGHPAPAAFYWGKKGVLAKYQYFADINTKMVKLNDSDYTHQIEGGLLRSTTLKNQQFGTMPTDPVTLITTVTKYKYLN